MPRMPRARSAGRTSPIRSATASASAHTSRDSACRQDSINALPSVVSTAARSADGGTAGTRLTARWHAVSAPTRSPIGSR